MPAVGSSNFSQGDHASRNPEVAIGSYPLFDPQHGPNTDVVLRVREAEARGEHNQVAEARSPSHGENRGSSGSANNFNNLGALNLWVWAPSPTFLQWTLLPKIGSRSPCDRPLEEAGRDWRSHRRAGIGAYFLKMTHARIAARTAEQIERAPCLAAREDGAGCLALAHVGGFAAE